MGCFARRWQYLGGHTYRPKILQVAVVSIRVRKFMHTKVMILAVYSPSTVNIELGHQLFAVSSFLLRVDQTGFVLAVYYRSACLHCVPARHSGFR